MFQLLGARLHFCLGDDGGYCALWLSLPRPRCGCMTLRNIWSSACGKGLKFQGKFRFFGGGVFLKDCFCLCLSAGSTLEVSPTITHCSTPKGDGLLLGRRRHLPSSRDVSPPFSPYIALSSDRGVLDPACLVVMDGPWCSTVATVIG